MLELCPICCTYSTNLATNNFKVELSVETEGLFQFHIHLFIFFTQKVL
jgi:hypothetical protein